ncbi:MAG TPA: class I SAM-dependent methyltransferase [Vicinamibacterales bacterium]|jgi:SAM-dependent methyltransferase|nr:class I SAM-dependent methyltransferase [Vicinamibacterales bacterium]
MNTSTEKGVRPLSVIQLAALRAFDGRQLPSGSRILDAPCGDGSLAAALRSTGYDAHGIDMNANGLDLLGASYYDVNLNARLPFADESFEAALSIEGIEHLENRFAYVRELHRVLKPNGLLILTTPNIVSLRSRVRFAGSGFFHGDSRPLREAEPGPFHHIGLGTLADVRYMLHTSGFRLMRVSHTHIKPVSLLYCWLIPWMWLYTTIALRKEKDAAQRRANREIRAALFSRSVLFGENLLVEAKRL